VNCRFPVTDPARGRGPKRFRGAVSFQTTNAARISPSLNSQRTIFRAQPYRASKNEVLRASGDTRL
jgi:hypothetical protein